MTAPDAVAAVMFAAIVLYAVFGGADFGSGVWDLTAGGAKRGAPTRRLIDHAVGPVWEANHVWLIFVLVFLWTGFPGPFATLMSTVAIPFWLAGLGIVARGASFAFRKYAPTLRWAQGAEIVFATASLITPFFLGVIAGAVASGRVQSNSRAGIWEPWTGPTSILGGFLAVATCTVLAGVSLAAGAEKLTDHALAEQLRRKSLMGGLTTGIVVLAGIPVLLVDDETLIDGLLGQALPLVIVSAVGGIATMYLLWTRQLRPARATAAIAVGAVGAVGAVVAVVAGWGTAHYPWILVDEATIAESAGADATMVGLLVAAGAAAVLVVPPLIYLFALANSNQVGTADPLA